jgi:hypothetical protein
MCFIARVDHSLAMMNFRNRNCIVSSPSHLFGAAALLVALAPFGLVVPAVRADILWQAGPSTWIWNGGSATNIGPVWFGSGWDRFPGVNPPWNPVNTQLTVNLNDVGPAWSSRALALDAGACDRPSGGWGRRPVAADPYDGGFEYGACGTTRVVVERPVYVPVPMPEPERGVYAVPMPHLSVDYGFAPAPGYGSRSRYGPAVDDSIPMAIHPMAEGFSRRLEQGARRFR